MPDYDQPPARRTMKAVARAPGPVLPGDAASSPLPELEPARRAFLAQVEAEGRELMDRVRVEIDALHRALPHLSANGLSVTDRGSPALESQSPSGDTAAVLARVLESLLLQNSQLHLQVETMLARPGAEAFCHLPGQAECPRVPASGPAPGPAPARADSDQIAQLARSLREAADTLERLSGRLAAGPPAPETEFGLAAAPPARDRSHEAAIAAERQRLAHEIHDGLTQQLTAVVLELEAALKVLPGDPQQARQRIVGATASSRSALGDIRLLIGRLRADAPHREELATRLARMAEALARETELAVQFDAASALELDEPRLEDEVARIAQEIFTNVRKHSQARTVSVALSRHGPDLELTVQDDGRGFLVREVMSLAAGAGKFGLLGLHERARGLGGNLTIASTPGRGTRVTLRVPIAAPGP